MFAELYTVLVDATQDSLGGLPTLHKTLCLRTLLFADALHGLPTLHKTLCAVLADATQHSTVFAATTKDPLWCECRRCTNTQHLFCNARQLEAGHACPHYTRISAQTQVLTLHTTAMSCSCTTRAAASAVVIRGGTPHKNCTLQKSIREYFAFPTTQHTWQYSSVLWQGLPSIHMGE